MWDGSSQVSEDLSINVEQDDCCAELMCLNCFYIKVNVFVLFNIQL